MGGAVIGRCRIRADVKEQGLAMPDLSPILAVIGALIPLECMQAGFMQRAMLGLLLLAPMTAAMGVQVINLRMAFFSDDKPFRIRRDRPGRAVFECIRTGLCRCSGCRRHRNSGHRTTFDAVVGHRHRCVLRGGHRRGIALVSRDPRLPGTHRCFFTATS